MTRISTAFSNSYAEGKPALNALYEYALTIPSLNGMYLALESSVDSSSIAVNSSSQVLTWYDVSGSTNYLYSSASTAPTFTPSDPLLNSQSSLDFGEIGNKQLLFKRSVKAKTIIIVYYLRDHRSYLLYCPANTPPPDPLFFDQMPSYGTSLWSNCTLTNNFAANSSSRINTRNVLASTYLPLNSPRILSVFNLGGNNQSVSLTGIGGRKGLPNGGPSTGGVTDSIKGSIAAILTFADNISQSELLQLELLLKDIYINYNGPSVTQLKPFKYTLNSPVSFDFASITVDEWSQPATYEILSPSTLSLNFNGSVLDGIASSIYDGKLRIRITNALNLQSTFEFPFEVVRADPLVPLLPSLSNLVLVLSSARNSMDLETYGVYKNAQQEVVKWDDARRIGAIKTLQLNGGSGIYETSTSPSVVFDGNDSYSLGSSVQGRTFLWVYKQASYGTRPMLDGFPDRKGNGCLWTTASTGQLYGQTDITKLATQVNKVPVNTLTFRNKLDKLSFITATQPDSALISIAGIRNLRGRLYFLAVWDTVLTTPQLHSAISVLADRYVVSQAPFIVNDDREYRYSIDVSVDLRTKIVDLKDRALTYIITQNNRNAVINGHILSFTAVTDEVLSFEITVTNSDAQTTQLVFEVDIVLRTNPLYLTLKSYLSTLPTLPNITDIYLATQDTLVRNSSNVLVQWLDYRLNTKYGTVFNATTSSLKVLGYKTALQFNIDGSNYVDFQTNITRSDWLVVYIKHPLSQGNVFLLGNDTQAIFGGTGTQLHTSSLASPSVIFGEKYLNKLEQNNSVELKSGVLNILYWHTTQPVTVDSIAKDRIFNSSSVKGYIPLVLALDKKLTSSEVAVMDAVIRDYYDPVRFVCLLHFNNNAIDISTEAKTITGSGSYVPISKFGSHALNLRTSLLSVPNDGDLAFLNESFTVSFQLLLTTGLDSISTIYLYRQQNLTMYIKGTTLYIDTDSSTSSSLVEYILPSSFYATQLTRSEYRHLELSRIFDYSTLTSRYELYVEGSLVGSVVLQEMYSDADSPGLVGGSTGNIASVVVAYMDELAIFKRGFLHDSNFIPPTSEYVV